MTSIPDVSWSRIAAFVRQHTHDLRNELNGLDLEAALLADIVTDPEALESVGRMRTEIRKVAGDLRALSGKFADPRPSPIALPARELFLIWQDQLSGLEPGPESEWTSEFGDEQVHVDPGGIAQALREMLVNARAFGGGAKMAARGRTENGHVIFELHEPKETPVDCSRWGRTPFEATRRGGYGLGLCALLKAVEANGGTVTWAFAPPELVTTLSFPKS